MVSEVPWHAARPRARLLRKSTTTRGEKDLAIITTSVNRSLSQKLLRDTKSYHNPKYD